MEASPRKLNGPDVRWSLWTTVLQGQKRDFGGTEDPTLLPQDLAPEQIGWIWVILKKTCD